MTGWRVGSLRLDPGIPPIVYGFFEDFESGASDWIANASAAALSTTESHSATHSIVVPMSSGVTPSQLYRTAFPPAAQQFNAKVSDWSLDYWTNCDSGLSYTVNGGTFYWFDGSGGVISHFRTFGGGGPYTHGWHHASFGPSDPGYMTTPAGAVGGAVMLDFGWAGGTDPSIVYVDDITVSFA